MAHRRSMSRIKGKLPVFVFLICFFQPAKAVYVERIDTTDDAGKASNGAFTVWSNKIDGALLVYGTLSDNGGYFNHSFNEIKKVPDSIRCSSPWVNNPCEHCFIVKDSTDGTYAKVDIIAKLPGNRYVFRYGRNTTPGERLLVPSDYDRNYLYKPNNIHRMYHSVYHGNSVEENIITWEPPIQGIMSVSEYVVYGTSSTSVTAVPFNKSQWELLTATRYPYCRYVGSVLVYLNIAAVYMSDTSEFLDNLTLMDFLISNEPSRFTVNPIKTPVSGSLY